MQNPLGNALFSNSKPVLGLLQQCIAIQPCGRFVAPHSCQLEAPCHVLQQERKWQSNPRKVLRDCGGGTLIAYLQKASYMSSS